MILLVDTGITGHRLTYINGIIKGYEKEFVVCLPTYPADVHCKLRVYKRVESKKRNILGYLAWLLGIWRIAREEKVDTVHFLYGDAFYRFFGIGLSLFRKMNCIMTIHSVREGKLKQLSLRRISKSIDTMVVHSDYLRDMAKAIGINSIEHIEYPHFDNSCMDRDEECVKWGIDSNIKVIGCLGSTRDNKGLDIILEALIGVNEPYQLLIAGAEDPDGFTQEYIQERISELNSHVVLHLAYLSDEEFASAVTVCDIIALPYRKSFNGASGPLGEGVWKKKCIIGPDHGNLGSTIRNNHLGYTFQTENSKDLARIVTIALKTNFVPDAQYLSYRENLSEEVFNNRYRNLYAAYCRQDK